MRNIVFTTLFFLFFSAYAIGQISETYCPDLVIKDIKILRQTSKKVTVFVTIANIGNMDAFLEGKTKKIQDNLGWRVYLSSDMKLNGGDILIGGDYFDGRSRLAPGDEISMESTFRIVKKTSFTPNLVIEMDAGEVVQECDEVQNNKGITLH